MKFFTNWYITQKNSTVESSWFIVGLKMLKTRLLKNKEKQQDTRLEIQKAL